MNTTPRAVFAVAAIAALLGCKTDAAAPAGDFEVRPDEVTLEVGQTRQLSASGAPGEVTWSSSNAGIATVVAQTGFVTAVDQGEALISAVSGSSVASARVIVTAPPAIALSAPTVDLDVTHGEGDPAAATVNVTNAGGGTLANLAVGTIDYADGQPDGWLEAALSGATAPATLTIEATAAGLDPGTYSAVVPVTSGDATNSPQNVVVTFDVVAPPSIAVDREQVSMVATPGATDEQQVAVTNGGGRPLTDLAAAVAYDSGAPGWLTATLSSTTAPATLELLADATSLAEGTYTAHVDISSSVTGVAPRTVGVTLSVGPGPAIELSDASAAFHAPLDGDPPAEQTVTVTNAGGGQLTDLSLDPVAYATGQPTDWLMAELDDTTAPATITLTVDATDLATGSYEATVTVRSPVATNTPQELTVTLTVGPPPVLAVTPTNIDFATSAGGTVLPQPQAVALTNASGTAPIAGLEVTITYSGAQSGWLENVTFEDGDDTTPTNLIVAPTTTDLPRGTHGAMIEVRSSNPANESRMIGVTYTVSTFSIDIAPFFSSSAAMQNPPLPNASCATCHPVGSAAAAYDFARSRVNPPNPNTGVLMCKITLYQPGVGPCQSPEGYDMRMVGGAVSLIRAWIAAGAPDN